MHYRWLIVGAGLFGAVFAREMKNKGVSCAVIDRRSHIAGNIYTEKRNGIHVHRYGAHIFHTSDKEVWEYVQQFAEFNQYINSPVARYGDEIYNLPFNMNTFSKMWGIRTPQEAKDMIARQVREAQIGEPANLEEQALSLVGRDIYEKLVKGYTEKQWGRDCTELPAFIIRRLPVRFIYDNNYFNDRYQGIPIGGYTAMVEKMLEGVPVILNTDFGLAVSEIPAPDGEGTVFAMGEDTFDKVLYTGMIDEFFGQCYGPSSTGPFILRPRKCRTRTISRAMQWSITQNAASPTPGSSSTSSLNSERIRRRARRSPARSSPGNIPPRGRAGWNPIIR